MAYNEYLAERIKIAVQKKGYAMEEKKMFGGIAFMYKNKMCVGVLKDKMMARIVKVEYEDALQEEHVEKMDFTGKPMTGFIFILPEGLDDDDSIERWIEVGVRFVEDKLKK